MVESEAATRIRDLYEKQGRKVPPAIEDRMDLVDSLGRLEAFEAVEIVKDRLIASSSLDHKLVQLIMFAQFLAQGVSTSAGTHAKNAVREGAALGEVEAIVEITMVSAGLPAYSTGMGILAELDAEKGR